MPENSWHKPVVVIRLRAEAQRPVDKKCEVGEGCLGEVQVAKD